MSWYLVLNRSEMSTLFTSSTMVNGSPARVRFAGCCGNSSFTGKLQGQSCGGFLGLCGISDTTCSPSDGINCLPRIHEPPLVGVEQ